MTRLAEYRFSLEYRCWPLWVIWDDGGSDTPDPHTFGLPPGLAERIVDYSDRYDALFDDEDFSAPLFASPTEEQAFEQEGLGLAREVAAALAGGGVPVSYSPLRGGRVVLGEPPGEPEE